MDKRKIELLIKAMKEQKITAYRVSKDTGVDQAVLSKLKSDERKIGSLQFDTAIKLNNYYEEMGI